MPPFDPSIFKSYDVRGIVGTQLALRASDDYTFWILKQAIFGGSANPTDTLGAALANLAPVESYNTLILLLIFYIPILFISVIQIILMIFRVAGFYLNTISDAVNGKF